MITIPELTVRGRLVDDHGPIEGLIYFTPTKLWFDYGSDRYAIKAGVEVLDDGTFQIELTPTDTFPKEPFYYDVYVDTVRYWRLSIPQSGEVQLADILPKKEPTE